MIQCRMTGYDVGRQKGDCDHDNTEETRQVHDQTIHIKDKTNKQTNKQTNKNKYGFNISGAYSKLENQSK